MRTDFQTLDDGDEIILHPLPNNLIHKCPVKATLQSGYLYCEGSPAEEGPDYYFGDVLRYCEGFTTPSEES